MPSIEKYHEEVASHRTAGKKAHSSTMPFVANTWAVNGYQNATDAAWTVLMAGGNHLDAIEAMGSYCEVNQCDGTVGYGGSPDETGETTLDAMIMDGMTMEVGAVADLREIKEATTVARFVLNSTTHSLLAGNAAANFAVQMGLTRTALSTSTSCQKIETWRAGNCQPNYWKSGAVMPDPAKSCGPYTPVDADTCDASSSAENPHHSEVGNHDSIGMIVLSGDGKLASGVSTNGATYKIGGRVGDSPIAGAGSYALRGVGACGATGDGDQMMRFLPCYQAVESLRLGRTPVEAATDAIARIAQFYPTFSGALIVVDATGTHAAACHGMKTWQYTYRMGTLAAHAIGSATCTSAADSTRVSL